MRSPVATNRAETNEKTRPNASRGAGTLIAWLSEDADHRWAIQILFALGVGAAGAMKLVRPKAQLEANSHMEIKLLAAAEVLGAIGLVLPTATGIAPGVARLAAACVATLMGGAVATHAIRRAPAAPAVVLLVVAAFR